MSGGSAPATLGGARTAGRGVALRGTVWPGGDTVPYDGWVVVAGDGAVAELAPAGALDPPPDLRVLGGPGHWIGPGVVDAHVHLAFGDPAEMLAGGVVAVRDLGAPPDRAREWRVPTAGRPSVAVAGPLCTAPGGYPSRSWGAAGFTVGIPCADAAGPAVREVLARGVDLVKLALEPAGGAPVPDPATVRAIVRAAHDGGVPVTAHALTADMVVRALDAGVDELCHTPVERLGERLVERVAASGVAVVSTLQTFFSGGVGGDAARNAAALHRAGVPLVYGTDLGNAGTRTGVDPRELDRLADTGLGRLGALRAATEVAARACGIRGPTGRIAVGERAALVLLAADPLVEPWVWRSPVAVVAGGCVRGV
ncbi:MAG TPA: amidohydrolase family protein [Mycobacteriales bacterium]|jgi:imidazolonepropionase-like amidohydrolase|nr:amidohydrolase family protein [Mycobacteriales bacterium]